MNGINIIPKILVIMTLIPKKNIYIIIQLMKKTKRKYIFYR